jgi:hypothetical protein
MEVSYMNHHDVRRPYGFGRPGFGYGRPGFGFGGAGFGLGVLGGLATGALLGPALYGGYGYPYGGFGYPYGGYYY